MLHGAALAAPLSFLRMFADNPRSDEISRHVRTNIDSELDAGRIDVDIDLVQIVAIVGFSAAAANAGTPPLYVRSQVADGSWTGVVSFDVDATIQSAGFPVAPSVQADEESLLCLERLGDWCRMALADP